jgi:hypothetical protein
MLPLPTAGPEGVLGRAEGMPGPDAEGSDMMCTMSGGSHLAKQPLQLSVRHTMPAPQSLFAHGFRSPLQLKISPAQPAVASWADASKHANAMNLCSTGMAERGSAGVSIYCCRLL